MASDRSLRWYMWPQELRSLALFGKPSIMKLVGAGGDQGRATGAVAEMQEPQSQPHLGHRLAGGSLWLGFLACRTRRLDFDIWVVLTCSAAAASASPDCATWHPKVGSPWCPLKATQQQVVPIDGLHSGPTLERPLGSSIY